MTRLTPLLCAVTLLVPATALASPDEVAKANNELGFALYQRARNKDGNYMLSAHSVAGVLDLVLPGARGKTREQLLEALQRKGWGGDGGFKDSGKLDQILASRAEVEVPWADFNNPDPDYRKQLEAAGQGFVLTISNGVWAQKGYPFESSYLKTVKARAGALIRELDFAADPGAARRTINEEISKQTGGMIPQALPPSFIQKLTRLVLTNAVYFDARWQDPFEPHDTKKEKFRTLAGAKVDAQMMHRSGFYNYAETRAWQAVELPYNGRSLSMVVVVPRGKRFSKVEKKLDAGLVKSVVKGLDSAWVELGFPKFEFDSEFQLLKDLSALGMKDCFDQTKADFSGLTSAEKVAINAIVQKTKVIVDEYGTKAAAATAMGVAGAGLPPKRIKLIIDRPFIFMIRDKQTNAILFLGRVVDPARSER